MSQTYHIDMGPMGIARENNIRMTVLRGYSQFSITVEVAQVRDTDFGQEVLQKLALSQEYPFGRCPPYLDPVHLVYQHCLPLFEKLAPQTALHDLRLECFIHLPRYHLNLVRAGHNREVRITGQDECAYTPAFGMSPMRTQDLPELCRNVPRYPASKVCIAPSRSEGKFVTSLQGEVIAEDGTIMYFKPRVEGRGPEFTRELRILSRMNEVEIGSSSRVPELKGIVVSGDDGEMTVGMLMTLIRGRHLRIPEICSQAEFHSKWEEQVTDVVRELHAQDIVWGDVHPMNVVIDEAMDAWIIDFGGMNNVEFVDEEKRETVEGDEQGIDRMFHVWLPTVRSVNEGGA